MSALWVLSETSAGSLWVILFGVLLTSTEPPHDSKNGRIYVANIVTCSRATEARPVSVTAMTFWLGSTTCMTFRCLSICTNMTILRVIRRFRGRQKSTQRGPKGYSQTSRRGLPKGTHRGLTEDSQRSRRGLTENSQSPHKGPADVSVRSRSGLTDDSQRTCYRIRRMDRGLSEEPLKTHHRFTEYPQDAQRIHRGPTGNPQRIHKSFTEHPRYCARCGFMRIHDSHSVLGVGFEMICHDAYMSLTMSAP